MKSTTTKIFLILFVTTLIIASCGIIFFASRTSQTRLSADHSQGILGQMALDSMPQFAVIRPGLRFKVDTGADFSTLTERDLHFLDSLGFSIKESTYPILGRDGVGDIQLETKRYTVDLPLYNWNITVDSLGKITKECDYRTINILSGVDFAPTDLPFSTLGMDFLEKFLVEYNHGSHVYNLFFDEPEGYVYCAEMKHSKSPLQWPMLGHRNYVEMSVGENTDLYFLDTGIRRAYVKCPTSQIPFDYYNLNEEIVTSLRGTYHAVADPDGWLTVGNREGNAKIFYYDNDEEPYAFNPLNMFADLDVLFDFPGNSLKFRN